MQNKEPETSLRAVRGFIANLIMQRDMGEWSLNPVLKDGGMVEEATKNCRARQEDNNRLLAGDVADQGEAGE